MIETLLLGLRRYPHIKVVAVALNDGILAQSLIGGGIDTIVIPEGRHSFWGIAVRAWVRLRWKGISIIHSHRSKENVLAYILGMLLRVRRLVSTIHGLPEAPLSGSIGIRSLPMKTRMDYFLLRRVFTKAVAVSEDIKRQLQQQYGFRESQVEVVVNGIDLPEAQRPHFINDNDKVVHVGTVGRMVAVKDYDLFLRFAAAVLKQEQNVRFSILGNGPLRDELVRTSRLLGLEEKMTFESPRSDPSSYYQSLDIYVNTSAHEGLPLSILEAMALGIPVIAAKVGGIVEIVDDGEHGLLVGCRDPEAYAARCIELIRDHDRRVELGKKASLRIAAAFNSSRMVDGYVRLYGALSMA